MKLDKKNLSFTEAIQIVLWTFFPNIQTNIQSSIKWSIMQQGAIAKISVFKNHGGSNREKSCLIFLESFELL